MAGPSDFMQRLPEVRLLQISLKAQKGPSGPFCARIGMPHRNRNGMVSLNLAGTGLPFTLTGSNSQILA